ncbi:C2 domain, partial [Dillenia turbinata]
MGNCCSDTAGGRAAVGGTGNENKTGAPSNDAVDLFLKSRGYRGLYSQIERLEPKFSSAERKKAMVFLEQFKERHIRSCEKLSFSASNLRDRDVLSKSDPMVVVYTKGQDGKLEELGRTEVVLNSLNPSWITKLNVTYHFEIVQTLMFQVYDVDTQFHNVDIKMLRLEEQQFLGETSCALSEIVTKSGRSLTLDLVRREEFTDCPKKFGQLTVCAEECVSSKTTTEMILRCTDLENKDLFSRSDPFLVISKIVEGGITIPVCKNEVIKNDLKPTWKPIFLSIQQVGSKDSPLTIECFNFNSNGKHDLIGKVQKSLAELEKLHSSGKGENLYVPTAVGRDSHNKVLKSQLFVDKYVESIKHTFLDYITGGYELNFMVAIDFTASNGNPHLPDSLHYIDPSGRPNAYQKVILEVGGVLQFYDTDNRFPAWGFGARPIDGPVSHCFNLNGSSSYCEVEGIHGIMTAYTLALQNVSLAGPTLFGPVVTNAALIASQSLAEGRQKYFVLLIITDGVITELQETKDALVKASDLPLSILIVGVGGADFKEMEVLDADKGYRLEGSTGRVASRDIVQFVPFRDVQSEWRDINCSIPFGRATQSFYDLYAYQRYLPKYLNSYRF